MDSFDWFYEMFGWVFRMTPMGWVKLFVALVAARVVFGWLWQVFFPDSYKAYKKKRRLARDATDNES